MRFSKTQQLAVVVIVLSGMMTGCAWLDQLSARNQLNRGVQAYTNKQYDEAIEHFEAAIEGDSELIDAWLYMAISYRAQYVPQGTSPENVQHGRLAIETFEEVLRMAPDDPMRRATAMANLAGIYSGMNDIGMAKEWYHKRLDEEPNNPEPMYGIATLDWQVAYDETGMDGEGLEELTEERRAEIVGYVDDGIGQLKRALEINTEYADAMQYLNLLYREKAKLTDDEEERKQWEGEADALALQALELKRKQEAEAEEARRKVSTE